MTIKTLQELAESAASNPDLKNKLQTDPVGTLQQVATTAAGVPNTPVYKIVVAALGLTVLISLIGAIALAWRVNPGTAVETPAIITALGSAAVGALAGLLAPSPKVGG
jgi:hypothetical protein